jgi:hypothetical protein
VARHSGLTSGYHPLAGGSHARAGTSGRASRTHSLNDKRHYRTSHRDQHGQDRERRERVAELVQLAMRFALRQHP